MKTDPDYTGTEAGRASSAQILEFPAKPTTEADALQRTCPQCGTDAEAPDCIQCGYMFGASDEEEPPVNPRQRYADRLALAIPEALKPLKQWLLWRRGKTKPNGKFDKIPIYANGANRHGKQGSPTDLEALADFNTAMSAYRRGLADGLGLAMLPGAGLIGIDLDGVIDADGEIDSSALALVRGSYAERSPSGRGLRGFRWGSMADAKHHASGTEIFHGAGFLTVTGDILWAEDIEPLTEELRAALLARMGTASAPERPTTGLAPNLPAISGAAYHPPEEIDELKDALEYIENCDYDTWLKVGMALKTVLPGPDGFGIWAWWSQLEQPRRGCDKWDEETATGKWMGFSNNRPGGTVNKETIFHLAQQAGWINPRAGRAIQPDLGTSIEAAGVPAPAGETYNQRAARLAEEFRRDLAARQRADEEAKKSRRLTTAGPVFGDADEGLEFVVDGWFLTGLYTIAGASGVGKTTCLLGLVPYIAGLVVSDALRVSVPRKVIVATEDAAQVKRTLRALQARLGGIGTTWDEWIHVLHAARMDNEWITREVRALMDEHHHDVGGQRVAPLLVLDTAARCLEIEDENKNAEINAMTSAILDVLGETGCCWLITHVTKADRKTADPATMTARGGGAFIDNAHGTAFVVDKDGRRSIVLGKRRFETEGTEIPFDTGTERQEAVNRFGHHQSLLVRWALPDLAAMDQGEPSAPKAKPLTGDTRACLESLVLALGEYGVDNPGGIIPDDYPQPARILQVEAWKQWFYDRPKAGCSAAAKRNAWKECRKTLEQRGAFEAFQDWVWPTPERADQGVREAMIAASIGAQYRRKKA